MTLKHKLLSYYRACGHDVRELTQYPHVVETRSRNQAGTDDVSLFWVEEEGPETPDRSSEAKIMGAIAQLKETYPLATVNLLLGSLSGYSKEFRDFSKSLSVRVHQEVLFFDAEFKSDYNLQAASVAKSLVAEAEEMQRIRVEQPFTRESGNGNQIDSGPCAVTRLFEDLLKPTDMLNLTFVVGPAGAGKSIAYNELFGRCYSEFQKRKSRRLPGLRPLPITPAHLSRSRGNTFAGVIQTFLQTEIARPIGEGGLNWMVDNGLLALMCDGLDEVLATDDHIFEFLEDRLTIPDSSGRIVVCVRDSLFNSCIELKSFLSDAGDMVNVLHLDKWKLDTKRAYFQKRSKKDQAGVEKFVTWIQNSESLKALSDNAFYCRIIADMFEQGQTQGAETASGVCEFALSEIIGREYQKGLIKKAKINEEELRQVLEACAAEDLAGGFTGIPIEELQMIAEISCTHTRSPEETEDFVMRLVQLPVFTSSQFGGKVEFTHEILGYFLLANHLVRSLKSSPSSFIRFLDNEHFLGKGALLTLLADEVRKASATRTVWSMLTTETLSEAGFRVLLQLAILSDPLGIPGNFAGGFLSHKKLAGVRFTHLGLKGAAFDQSDLTNAAFLECDLRGAKFDGALLYNTSFDLERHDLEGIHISDVSNIHSIRFGGRYFDDVAKIVQLLTGSTAGANQEDPPCPASRQVAQLFGKFVFPNGQPRKASIDLRGFLAGKRFDGAPHNDDILAALCHHGYLEKHLRPKPGVERATGDRWHEIIEFVTRKSTSQGLKTVISELCTIPNCKHGFK